MNTSNRIGFVANVHNVIPSLTDAMKKALRDPQCYGKPGTRSALHKRGLIAPAIQTNSKRRYTIWLRTVFGYRTLETLFPNEHWKGPVGVHRDEIFNRCAPLGSALQEGAR